MGTDVAIPRDDILPAEVYFKPLINQSAPALSENHSVQCKIHQGQRHDDTSTTINKSLLLLGFFLEETKIIHYPAYSLYTLPRSLPSCQSQYNTAPTLPSRDITEGKLFNNLSAAVDTRHFSTLSLFITLYCWEAFICSQTGRTRLQSLYLPSPIWLSYLNMITSFSWRSSWT